MTSRSTLAKLAALASAALLLCCGSAASAYTTGTGTATAGACGAPVKPNGGELPNDISISPHSGSPAQLITLHLSPDLIASRQWNGFYIMWDQMQPLMDGGGPPPATLTFTPPDYNETGSVAFQSPGYHTVDVYDTYSNVGTIEPQSDVASASFYITSGPALCTTPTINQLQLPQSVRGGHILHVALVTNPHARVHLIVRVPAAAGSPSYVADVEGPADSASGAFALDVMIPARPKHMMQATVTITAHIGSNSLRQVAQLAVTP